MIIHRIPVLLYPYAIFRPHFSPFPIFFTVYSAPIFPHFRYFYSIFRPHSTTSVISRVAMTIEWLFFPPEKQ